MTDPVPILGGPLHGQTSEAHERLVYRAPGKPGAWESYWPMLTADGTKVLVVTYWKYRTPHDLQAALDGVGRLPEARPT